MFKFNKSIHQNTSYKYISVKLLEKFCCFFKSQCLLFWQTPASYFKSMIRGFKGSVIFEFWCWERKEVISLKSSCSRMAVWIKCGLISFFLNLWRLENCFELQLRNKHGCIMVFKDFFLAIKSVSGKRERWSIKGNVYMGLFLWKSNK